MYCQYCELALLPLYRSSVSCRHQDPGHHLISNMNKDHTADKPIVAKWNLPWPRTSTWCLPRRLVTAGDWSLVAEDKNQQFLETIVLFHFECGQHRREGDQDPCKLHARHQIISSAIEPGPGHPHTGNLAAARLRAFSTNNLNCL